MPTWLAPVQVKILPISDQYLDYCAEINQKFLELGVRVELDTRSEKIGYKIREAQLEKVPYMLIAGEKERAEGTVSVRSRKEGDQGAMPVDAFIEKILEEIKTRAK